MNELTNWLFLCLTVWLNVGLFAANHIWNNSSTTWQFQPETSQLHSFSCLPSVVNNKSSKKMISVQNQPLHTVTTISISITFHNGTRANYHDKYTCNVIWQTAHAHCVLLLLVHTYARLVRIIQIQPTPCKLSFFNWFWWKIGLLYFSYCSW